MSRPTRPLAWCEVSDQPLPSADEALRTLKQEGNVTVTIRCPECGMRATDACPNSIVNHKCKCNTRFVVLVLPSGRAELRGLTKAPERKKPAPSGRPIIAAAPPSITG